jgi:hypothetical protein
MNVLSMRSRRPSLYFYRLPLAFLLLVASAPAFGQENVALNENSAADPSGSSAPAGDPIQPSPEAKSPANPLPPGQPKRILGIMPNFRAVGAGVIPPPPTPKEAFGIATRNSFDYSSFVFVGVTSLLAEGNESHPQLGNGIDGFARYYWRGFADKTVGNYLVIFALPTFLHQDERYYAMGQGSKWKRLGYSLSRVAVTPNYQGHNTFNTSELLGRGIAQGISLSYYPSQTRTPGEIAEKYGYAILRDAMTNAFREFWPDIAVHVLHRHP